MAHAATGGSTVELGIDLQAVFICAGPSGFQRSLFHLLHYLFWLLHLRGTLVHPEEKGERQAAASLVREGQAHFTIRYVQSE